MTANRKALRVRPIHAEWAQRRDKAKHLWVIAVFGFWITLAILGVVYFLKNALDLVLLSISVGMAFLGVWLKARYQLILRREPNNSDHGEDHQSGV